MDVNVASEWKQLQGRGGAKYEKDLPASERCKPSSKWARGPGKVQWGKPSGVSTRLTRYQVICYLRTATAGHERNRSISHAVDDI